MTRSGRSRRSGRRRLLAAQQPVCLFDHGQVAQRPATRTSVLTGRCARPVGKPQVLGQPDEHGAHEEGLVPVVSHILDLEHDVVAHQRAEIDLVAAFEEPARRPLPQARQPHPDEAEHVVGDALAVADLADHLFSRALQIGQRGVPGGDFRRLAEREVPAGLLVCPGQRRAEHLRERLLGLERRDEKGLYQIRVGLQRKPRAAVAGRLERVQAGGGGIGLTWPDPYHRSAWDPVGHEPVLGLGRFDDEPGDVLSCGCLEQRPDGLRLTGTGRAAHEHVPVQRVERQREGSRGHAVAVEDVAEADSAAGDTPRFPCFVGFLSFLGDIEGGAQREPQPRDL